MKHLFTLIWILFLLGARNVMAQNGEIRGKILTQDNKSFEGVNITLKDTKYGNTTNADGKFQLKAPKGNYTLIVSLLGNEKKELPVEITAGKVLTLDNIQLQENSISLQDAVVTGQFGKQSLRNSVYQVRTIDSERIRARGATNIQTILNTELGITVFQRSYFGDNGYPAYGYDRPKRKNIT